MGLGGLGAMALVSVIAFTPTAVTIAPSDDRAPVATERSWQAHVRLVDEAVARGDISAAVRTWHDAYALALATRRPEAIVEAGDAFVRVSVAAGTPDGGKPNARRAYMAALMHAQRQQSVDGVLGVARAFRALGDLEAADYCVRIAGTLAARQGRR
jgi:hypothetical protein